MHVLAQEAQPVCLKPLPWHFDKTFSCFACSAWSASACVAKPVVHLAGGWQCSIPIHSWAPSCTSGWFPRGGCPEPSLGLLPFLLPGWCKPGQSCADEPTKPTLVLTGCNSSFKIITGRKVLEKSASYSLSKILSPSFHTKFELIKEEKRKRGSRDASFSNAFHFWC